MNLGFMFFFLIHFFCLLVSLLQGKFTITTTCARGWWHCGDGESGDVLLPNSSKLPWNPSFV